MHSKPNVCFIIYANPDNYPPIINAVKILSEHLNIILICRNQNDPRITYPENVRVLRLGRLESAKDKQNKFWFFKLSEFFAFTFRAVLYAWRYRCRLIYANDAYGFMAGLLASRIGPRRNIIYHNHDFIIYSRYIGLRNIIRYFGLRLARFNDAVVFPSSFRMRYFRRYARLKKSIFVVMNTPLLVKEPPVSKWQALLKARGFNPVNKVILYQGQFIGKGVCLAEVLQSVPLWREDVLLAIIGDIDQDYRQTLESEIEELGLESRVIFLPCVAYPEILNYASGAHLGLALRKHEDINARFLAGASNKIFEYMALGIPALVNDSLDFRLLFKDTPCVYFSRQESVRDIAGIVNASLTEQAEYAAKKQACLKAHREKFNYESQFAALQEFILRKALG